VRETKTEKIIRDYFDAYLKLPWTEDSIPGDIVEIIISHAHDGHVLKTYDYVDVVNDYLKVGWQVKSTKEKTPITWKRAKIPNKENLIKGSLSSEKGIQILGDSIIDFCNKSVKESIDKYDLSKIIYSRCILFPDRTIRYFEREIATKKNPNIFDNKEFFWKWSKPKKTATKEQLPSLMGFRKSDNLKFWAWHGHGENQLHFSGEKIWWDDPKNIINIKLSPPDRIDFDEFFEKMS
tara:strand:+ start:113 stop:820 length:708 start_codon:yes stop_codon:yes gene_type:complete